MWKLAIAGLLASTAVVAQADDTAAEAVEIVKASAFTELPAEIKAAIQARNPVQILSIDGAEQVSDGLVYVDELIIQRGGRIVFSDLDKPYLAVVARRVRIVDSQTPFSISRVDTWRNLDGAKGKDGAGGAGGGRSGRHGNSGSPGHEAGNGSAGRSFDMPPVYIVIGSIEDARSGADVTAWDITYNFDGFRGGKGGDGGIGGRGGNGGSGKKWKKAWPAGCGRGPGRGGNGAAGGKGGNGAKGGDGGDGSAIAFFATQAVADVLTVGDINNYGAEAGPRGAAGRGGDGGNGGNAGSKGDCSSESDGRNGAKGANGQPGPANPNNGERGEVLAYILPSEDAVFE